MPVDPPGDADIQSTVERAAERVVRLRQRRGLDPQTPAFSLETPRDGGTAELVVFAP